METQVSRARQYRERTQRNDLKQHADKIIQGIKKIGPNHAKRAIWELFQNAVDLSPSSEIILSITDSELIFSHNGVPFTMHTLDCLFTQVSSKTLNERKLDREEADPIGQYGTGFLTSHSFGDVVKVSGAIQDDFKGEDTLVAQGHIEFTDLIIDRSTQDWEKLCDEISNLRNKVTELLSQPLTFDQLPKTRFKFGFNSELNRKRACDAIESLKTVLPYVMIFNDRLKKVIVTDNLGNSTTYIKDDVEESTEYFFSRAIHINNLIKKINYLKTDRLIIVLPIDNNSPTENFIGMAELSPTNLPRLFLFYPLIGTEHLGFNYIVHSKNFQPTEPRDGLHLNSENEKNKIEELANQKLIQEASDLIFSFLESNLSKIQCPHLLAEINFPVSRDNAELNEYFVELKVKWTSKFKSLPFVETQAKRISAQEAMFLKTVVINEGDAPTLEAIYNIVSSFYTNVPKSELIPIWTKLMDDWNITDVQRIGFSEIADEIQEKGTIESFKKEELIYLYIEMIRKAEGELFANKSLLPNIKGQFKKQVELSKSVDLTDELITLADVINPKITNRQIDEDFLLEGLEFEPFGRRNYMELINASLDQHIRDGTRSYTLPENYLACLIQYASITPKEESISGPVRVIKLIELHYNLQLTSIILPSVPGEDNIDIRKGQSDLFKVFLNDISDKDAEWTKGNINELAKVLREAFNYADVKKIFLRYDVFPNQLHELKPITSLLKDNKIPEFVKDLYDCIVETNKPIRAKLANAIIENIHDEMKPTKSLDLTSQIEQRFFGESGNEIHMENHPYKSHIIDIIRNFKPEQDYFELYERLFPATSRNKSAILVQLADGEASFAILSQNEAVIKKLAKIAGHPNLDELIRLGEVALLKKRQEEAEMQYKKKIGNHLEDVLRERLSQSIDAKVIGEQDGQDLVIYINEKPIYYIEVKSRWLDTTPIRISRNQTLRAHENPNCFALCSIDMTVYTDADKYEVKAIENIIEFMKFNTDIGSKVGHLVDIYTNAHQVDSFSLDGDYRTLIPSKYIKEGLDLGVFESELLKYIKSNYGNQN